MEKKNVQRIVIGIFLLLLLGVGIYFSKNILPTVNSTLEIKKILQPILDAENKFMHLEIEFETGEQSTQLDVNLYTVKEEEKSYLGIEHNGTQFYVVDNLILLENGKAFLLTEEGADSETPTVNYMDFLSLLAVAFDELQIERVEENEEISYEMEVTGEQMQELLAVTMPSKVDNIDGIESLQVKLATAEGVLDYIQMNSVTSSSDKNIFFSMKASNFAVLSEGEYQIPQAVKNSLETVDKDKLFCLTEDLYRLIRAVEPLSNKKDMKGTMNWQVSCGLLQINTSMDLEKLKSMKEDGTGGSGKEQEVENAKEFIGLMSSMIAEGELSCSEENGVYVYELTLNENTMKELAETIAPEMVAYAVNFEKGSLRLTIEAENLSVISVGMEGSVNALFTKVPMSLKVTFDFE